MTDFPRSLIEFQRRFPDEQACAVWLAGRLSLPACGHDKRWALANKRFTGVRWLLADRSPPGP